MIDSRTFQVTGGAARTSVSVGVSCSPADGTTSGELLSVADSAMYLRKDIRRADPNVRIA
jgi:GGDEF domain-containing protein